MAKKNTKAAADRTALLNTIVADTKSAQGYSLVNPEYVKELIVQGHIEVNPNITGTDGKIAARATEALLASNAAGSVATEATAPSQPAVYTLMGGIPIAPSKRGGKKTEEYPFSKMEVNQSFVVPATASYPEPWNTFASTVSSATRRFSTIAKNEDGTNKTKPNRKGEQVNELVPTKKFTLRKVEAGQKYPNGFEETVTGARVFRIA